MPPAARVVNDPLNSRFSFVELTNPEAYAVDISNWRLQGAWGYDFAAGERLVSAFSPITLPRQKQTQLQTRQSKSQLHCSSALRHTLNQ